MKKIIVLLLIPVFFNATLFAGLQRETPYSPPSPQQYRELKKFFPDLTDAEIEKSIKISKKQNVTDIINNILVYLKYKKLIKQTKKLPPIFIVYSKSSNILSYVGGLYYDVENIIVLNANLFHTDGIHPNNLPKHMQQAVDFVTFAAIIGHELMHYEDLINESEIYNMDGAILNEWKAYKRSEKIIEYFMKMPKEEADEVIHIGGFYESVQRFEEHFINMRRHYIKIIDAANIVLNNEDKICKKLGLDKEKFKMLSFSPRIIFNEKNGGHIVKVESHFLNLQYRIFFETNIISGELKFINTPEEIKKFKEEAANITLIDKYSYTIKQFVPVSK